MDSGATLCIVIKQLPTEIPVVMRLKPSRYLTSLTYMVGTKTVETFKT